METSDGLVVPKQLSIQRRAEEAYRLRCKGSTWEEVARACHFRNGNVAASEVRIMLTKMQVRMDNESRVEILNMEMDRLDSLQAAVWDQAMDGDYKAVDTVLKVMNHRAKLLGLDEAQPTNVTNTTILVSRDDERFVTQLKMIAGETA